MKIAKNKKYNHSAMVIKTNDGNEVIGNFQFPYYPLESTDRQKRFNKGTLVDTVNRIFVRLEDHGFAISEKEWFELSEGVHGFERKDNCIISKRFTILIQILEEV